MEIKRWASQAQHQPTFARVTLAEGDSNFILRWRLIKSGFSRALPKTESLSAVRQAACERGIWQRHFWEHLIRDDLDFQRHIDYIHVNPLKHGLVKWVGDWPYSTFHRYVDAGIYVADWCGDALLEVVGGARRTCDYASLIAPTSSRGEGTGCDSVSA